MIGLAIEGLESAFFPCSIAILFPGLIALLAGRGSVVSVGASFSIGAIAVAWLRFSTLVEEPSSVIVFLLFSTASALFAVSNFPAVLGPAKESAALRAGALFTGASASSIWTPCVGSEFGSLLGVLPNKSPSDIAGLGIYTLGVLTPLVVVGAILYSIPEPTTERIRRPVSLASAGVLALIAISAAIGQLDGFVSRLVAWSV